MGRGRAIAHEGRPGMALLTAVVMGIGVPPGVAGQAAASAPARTAGDAVPAEELRGFLERIRFFEDDASATPLGEREYATEFERARTRYVWVELQFDHPSPGNGVEFTVECAYLKPDGSERGRVEMPFSVEPEWTGAVRAHGWGNAEAGTWEAGRYTVSCTRGDRPVAEGSFEIVSGPPDIASIGAKLMSLRFFEGATDPGWGERQYADEFEAASARYVYTELRIQLPARDHAVDLPVGCLYIRDDGTLMGEVDLDLEIQPQWEQPQIAKGFGWAEPGSWSPGTYRVACVAEGRLLAERTFELR